MKIGLRANLLFVFFILFGSLIVFRLFYWQVLASSSLKSKASEQHWVSFEVPASRGEILASDGFPLAKNQEAYLLYASIPELKESPSEIAKKISPIIDTLGNETSLKETEEMVISKLEKKDLVWVAIKHRVSAENRRRIENLAIDGLGFEEEKIRGYPEGTSSAQLLGFLGSDAGGNQKGYFGVEGYYDLELQGRSGFLRREKDATGKPILIGQALEEKQTNGRSLVTTIDRTVQFIASEKLKLGIEKYEAESGLLVITDPQTGAILSMSSYPSYDPEKYFLYDKSFYLNPIISSSYEPGSTFKVIVMASALNEGVIDKNTVCDKCSGPRVIYEDEIDNWNNEYFPNTTMADIILHSDNVGMTFVADRMGINKLFSSLERFGFGKSTGIDLQEESVLPLRKKEDWKEIDLATASFGQGVAVTPLQMIDAVSVIANGGKLMKPYVVKKVIGENGESEIKPKVVGKIISPKAASDVTEMMVRAVDAWADRWGKPQGFRVAGKTGTAQVPVAGHYDKDRVVASFVGFAPADNPRFAMLVALREPKTSPWGSQTAAPLWFDIARELLVYYGVLPGM